MFGDQSGCVKLKKKKKKVSLYQSINLELLATLAIEWHFGH